MASIDKFEDHCWKDVVPEADMRMYAPYARDTAVGPNPALLAIDLYNLVYEGGPKPPIEITPQYPSSCGIHAHRAIEPTKRLIAAARRAGIADLLLHAGYPQQCAAGGRGLDQTPRARDDAGELRDLS